MIVSDNDVFCVWQQVIIRSKVTYRWAKVLLFCLCVNVVIPWRKTVALVPVPLCFLLTTLVLVQKVCLFLLFVCVFVTMFVRTNELCRTVATQIFCRINAGLSSCRSCVLHTHGILDGITKLYSRSNFKIATPLSDFIVQRKNKYIVLR